LETRTAECFTSETVGFPNVTKAQLQC